MSSAAPSSASPTGPCSGTCATNSVTTSSRCCCPATSDWNACRELFGDDRADYAEALDRHYRSGPPADWPQRFVSAYATMHPWEDWAETFAHYLHIRDTLQTASEYGVVVSGPRAVADKRPLESTPRPDAAEHGFDEMVGEWLPLTYALNAVNRSMGREDLYPFTLAQPVIDKLTFVHAACPVHAAGVTN